jgi:uncharacterized protein YcbX
MPSQRVTVARLTLYPFKSLDGVEVTDATVVAGAGFEYDRRFALFDADGRVVNGKRTDAVHGIRTQFDLAAERIRLSHKAAAGSEFSLRRDLPALEEWFSRAFGFPVHIRENTAQGFPDDLDSPGPTIVGDRSLARVADWFGGWHDGEARRRFRANIELATPAPFWEDQLAGEKGATIRFRVGEAVFDGVNPCQRCVVPTRDSTSGDVTSGFQKAFATHREGSLPEWSPRSRFNHFYRLAINTCIVTGGVIRVGDAVELESQSRSTM